MDFTFLSGGTGTPKLLEGFRKKVEDDNISVICNTGDDYLWYGLHVSPDLDTVLYLFSGKLDKNKFWGVAEDAFTTIEILRSLGEDVWFNVGNEDLGLHLYRTKMLKEHTLTEITRRICKEWNITALILPMCNQPLYSVIKTEQKSLNFQEYFVKYHWKPEVKDVKYVGSKGNVPEITMESLKDCNQVVIGPSNPITSIGPILSLLPIRKELQRIKKKVVLISPIKGNRVFSGPTSKLMKAMNFEVSPLGLAKYYKKFVSTIILDPSDKIYENDILDLGIEPLYHSIDLSNQEQKNDLANFIINQF